MTDCHECGRRMITATHHADPVWCDDCNRQAELVANKLLDRAALKLEAALNPANAAKFRDYQPDKRRAIVCMAIESGHFKWVIS